jgi:hypothetical protein
VFVHVTSVSDASVFNDGEAAIVRSCQKGECHCSAKCDGAQSPGSIEISHKAEAIKRGQAFLKLNILLVGYYGSVTEPGDHPTNLAGQLFTGNIQSRRDIGIGGKRLTVPKNNKSNAGLIWGFSMRSTLFGGLAQKSPAARESGEEDADGCPLDLWMQHRTQALASTIAC